MQGRQIQQTLRLVQPGDAMHPLSGFEVDDLNSVVPEGGHE